MIVYIISGISFILNIILLVAFFAVISILDGVQQKLQQLQEDFNQFKNKEDNLL